MHSLTTTLVVLSFSVTTGNAFCGSIGSNVRAEYAVVGDVINLAARLMSAAQIGEVLCDDKTRDETKELIEYLEPQEISVKGKSAQVKVYPVQHQQTKTSLDPNLLLDSAHALPYGCEQIVENVPLFGSSSLRSDRRGGITAATAINAHPQHRVLIVAGETGTGKTMLLRHFLSHHGRCFMGSGDPVDATNEFHAWGGIVREMTTRTVKMAKGSLIADLSFTGETSQRNYEDRIDSVVAVNQEPDAEFAGADASALATDESRPAAKVVDLRSFTGERSNSEASVASSEKSTLSTALHQLGMLALSRPMDSLTSTYERVAVVDYLVHKARISRSMVPILNDLLPYDQLYQGSFGAFMRGEERSKALEHIIFSMVEALSAHKPILLIFDNAQWMDGMSWSLVLKVLEELPNVYCLIGTRSQSRAMNQPLFELIEQLPYVKRQELRRFSYQVTSLFLCQHYHIAIMDTQVLDFVYARTDGNPAELMKLMEFMIASKYIAIDRVSGVVTILSDLDDLDMQVPQYTRARVMSCIDALDGLAQLAIKVISTNPEPVEERMVNRILNMFLTADRDDSGNDLEGGGFKLKVAPSDSGLSIQKQVRIGLAECEKEAILTIDDHKKMLFFNSEEMRLVVYDTMLPSQREALHALYCHWFREATGGGESSQTSPGPRSLPKIGSGTSGTENAVGRTPMQQYQQLAMLGYHLSRSDSTKTALEAYLKASEQAIEAKELAFATDCMQSSFKILDDQPRTRKLNDLDYILLRSRVEFMRGAIAVEKSEWENAITHMSYIIRLCQRKGSVLRRYSSSVHYDGMFESTAKTSSVLNSINPSSLGLRRSSAVLSALGILHLDPSDSLWYIEMQERCMPALVNLRGFSAWTHRTTSKLLRRRSSKSRLQTLGATATPIATPRGGGSGLMRMISSRSRIQPEETLVALNQVNFYRRKAEILIKKICDSKHKQEGMSRDIQRLTQRSLQTKQKR